MNYYYHRVNGLGACCIGTEKEQIISLINYYKKRGEENLIIPKLEDIESIKEVTIPVAFPFLNINHFIYPEVRENITFMVNANAYHYMINLAQFYERQKRSELYKFQTIESFGLWFLPEYIMEGIRKFDWRKYDKQVSEWLEEREKSLQPLEDEGKISVSKIIPLHNMN